MSSRTWGFAGNLYRYKISLYIYFVQGCQDPDTANSRCSYGRVQREVRENDVVQHLMRFRVWYLQDAHREQHTRFVIFKKLHDMVPEINDKRSPK